MEDGDYKKKIDFSKFHVFKFRPSLYASPYNSLYGCGGAALALLSDTDPLTIPSQPTWPDSYMINFLKKKGFQVQKLTKYNIANRPGVTNPLTKNHLLLISMMFRRREASWVVYFDRMLYHNFEITELQPLDFINLPIVSAYMLKPPYSNEN